MGVLDSRERLSALRALGIMDSPPEPMLDALVAAASTLCEAPISLISLVDERRQWFMANFGLEGVRETPRAHAFCAHAIESTDMFVVEDARADARFADNPLVVGAPTVRFYAGAPLVVSGGQRLGTLCVIDRRPRALGSAQREALVHLARAASILLERRLDERTSPSVETSEEAMAILDLDGLVAKWNASAEALLGIEASRAIERDVTDFVSPRDRDDVRRAMERVRETGLGCSLDASLLRGAFAPLALSVVLIPLTDADGSLVGTAMLLRERQVQRRLDTVREQRMASLSQRLGRVGTTPRPTLSRVPPAKLLLVDDDPTAIHVLRGALADYDQVRFAMNGADALRIVSEWRPDLVLLDGEMPGESGLDVCAALKANPELADIPVIFVTAHDNLSFEARAIAAGAADFLPKPVSPARVRLRVQLHLQLRSQLASLRASSLTDELTSLANRRAFQDRITRECDRAGRSGAPLSLLIVDVDYFKKLNDTDGHPVGDACLRCLADVIGQSLYRTSDLAARIGGEEFAVLLPETTAHGAARVAERIRLSVASRAWPHRASDVAPHVTVSVGAATWEVDVAKLPGTRGATAHPDALLEAADKALYSAKSHGRNRVEVVRIEV